jgi:hypothetical protein
MSSTPADSAGPAAVTGAGFTEGNLQNTVRWTNSTDCDFTGVVIRYRTDGTFPSQRDGSDGSSLVGTKTGGTPGAADSYLHTNLTNGTPYYYTIWAYDDELTPQYSITGVSPVTYAVPHDVNRACGSYRPRRCLGA